MFAHVHACVCTVCAWCMRTHARMHATHACTHTHTRTHARMGAACRSLPQGHPNGGWLVQGRSSFPPKGWIRPSRLRVPLPPSQSTHTCSALLPQEVVSKRKSQGLASRSQIVIPHRAVAYTGPAAAAGPPACPPAMAEQQQQQCISTLASALEQQEPAGHTQLERLLQYGLANCFSPQATPQASGDGQEASAGMFGGCIVVAAFACALGQLLALPFLPHTTALPPAPAGGLAQGDGACVCVCVLLACVRACM